jgi:hypothetical protein
MGWASPSGSPKMDRFQTWRGVLGSTFCRSALAVLLQNVDRVTLGTCGRSGAGCAGRLRGLAAGTSGAAGTALAAGTELAARSHREHRRRSAAVEHHVVVSAAATTTVVSPAVVTTAAACTEDEPGEEDHRDDEHHPGDDSHPRSHGRQA